MADLFRKPRMPGEVYTPNSPEMLAQKEAQGMQSGGMPPGMPMPPPPPPPSMGEEDMDFTPASAMPPPQSLAPPREVLKEDIEEISEKIIDEKWKSIEKNFRKLEDWKDETHINLTKLQEDLVRMDTKIGMMEKAIFGKVEEYSKGILDVNVELKAMQKVFKTMLPEFTANIKELRSLVSKAKPKLKKK